MQSFGLDFRPVLFMKFHLSGPTVDLETSNIAHFLGNYLGQVYQTFIWIGGPIEGS